MIDSQDQHHTVTPSVVYCSEYAVAAVNGGAGGYLHVRLDGREWINSKGGDSWVIVTKVLDERMDLISEQYDQRTPAGIHEPVELALRSMRAFISFLLACVESKSEDSENYYLFETKTREWAELNSDELQMISLEIDDELGESND